MNTRALCWAALVPVAAFLGCSRPKPPTPEPLPAPVTVTAAYHRTVPVQIRVIGKVKAISTVSIRPQVEGRLTRVHFKQGDYVKKRQKLFSIDPRSYQAAVRQAEANVAKSKALLLNAEQYFARVGRLSGIAVTPEEVDAARAAEASARATLAADEAILDSTRLQESYTTITSPLEGRTGELLVTAGNLVAANDANPLVVVNQISPIHVAFALPEQQFPEVAAAHHKKPLKVEVFVHEDEPPVAGELMFIDNAVDNVTGTVQLKAEFKNANRKLWPGQFVDVVLTIREQPGSVVVPAAAVQSGQQGEYVFVVTTEKKAELRPVTVAFESDGEAVIASGLGGGETVVVEGQLRLAPGTRVEAKNDTRRLAEAAPGNAPRPAEGGAE
jgi:multidrug efflux system membrane fusion protein